jgi:iron(III) transport system substrate-binding protein
MAARPFIAIGALLLAACSAEEPSGEAPENPVVVYADREVEGEFKPLFDEYREETSTIVIVRYGDPEGVVDDVIRNDISPPADILLTSTVMEAWRAAEEGALRPIYSQLAEEGVPAWAKDPDGLWLGLGFDVAVIVSAGIEPPGDYTSLADERFAGTLCLSSSAIPMNQVVMAMLIDAIGVRQTELAVRGWVRNLALPPFDTQEKLVGALQEGLCQAGIVSARTAQSSRLQLEAVAATYGDVYAAGLARHAQNPDGAMLLVEWLIEQYAKEGFADNRFGLEKNIGRAAWNRQDAVKLAERAGYR